MAAKPAKIPRLLTQFELDLQDNSAENDHILEGFRNGILMSIVFWIILLLIFLWF